MGLDCYVRVRQPNATDDEPHKEIWYGRKTNEIHGWMEAQWVAQAEGRSDEDFNCEELILTRELLDQLEQDHAAGKLMYTPGFFFGGRSDKSAVADDVTAILTASRQALDAGFTVFYFSWW